jgi:molybdenum cofactor biosynthesis enzyme MoaA
MRCAERKIRALENLCAENIFVTLGMLLVRGVNVEEPRNVLQFAQQHRQIRDLHLRGIGPIGRHMESESFTIQELVEVFARNADVDPSTIHPIELTPTAFDFRFGQRLRVQLTRWPDLGNMKRGRVTPEGRVAPFFEHLLANEGGY